ncbi:hypothetical protein T4B_6989, partial [Trichinella pseudospiralis]
LLTFSLAILQSVFPIYSNKVQQFCQARAALSQQLFVIARLPCRIQLFHQLVDNALIWGT